MDAKCPSIFPDGAMPDRRVEWLEWGDEAFRRAQAEDKPILLALGVGWDQWCRLMERDTYGDTNVAMLLNRDYVPVRVDADRRPDINDRYNVGGWPSTVFLTPEGDLLWGAASLDPSQMTQVLARLREGFATQRAKLAEAIRERDTKVRLARAGMVSERAVPGEEIMRRTMRGIVRTYDPLHGGFGPAPRFAQQPSLRLLVQALHESGGDEFRSMLERSLDVIGWKGLHDRVEGGFHRLAAGEGWSGIRTEKLAADNAAHIRLFLEAGQVMDEPRYIERARSTAAWAMKTLRDGARGVFAASQAADDEYFGSDAAGRAKRTPPGVDRTLIAEANAELASALMQASVALDDEPLGAAGRRALEAVLSECRDEARGLARYHDGKPQGFGILRDHAYVARALIDAYEHYADRRYLSEAQRLVDETWGRFWSEEEQALLDRRPGFEELGELRLRRRNVDEAAVACQAALRLSLHTGGEAWRAKAERTLAGFQDYGDDYGHHTAEYAAALDWLVRPATEITVVAPFTVGWVEGMRVVAMGCYHPRRVVRWFDPAMDAEAIRARGLEAGGAARAYVVRAGKALPPARSPSELSQQLRRL